MVKARDCCAESEGQEMTIDDLCRNEMGTEDMYISSGLAEIKLMFLVEYR